MLLYNEGHTASKMASYLGCSKNSIYKKLYELNMPLRASYSHISDEELSSEISKIHNEHPNAGLTVSRYLSIQLWEVMLDFHCIKIADGACIFESGQPLRTKKKDQANLKHY